MLNLSNEKSNLNSDVILKLHDIMSEKLFHINNKLINGSSNSLKLTIEKIAELVDLPSLDDMMSYYYLKSPPFSLFKKYEEVFNISYDECLTNKLPTFNKLNQFQKMFYAHNERNVLRSLPGNVEKYIFVKSDCAHGRITLIAQLTNYKFIVFSDFLNFSSQKNEIEIRNNLVFFRWIQRLIFNKNLIIESRQISKNQFTKLINGEIYPQSIVEEESSNWIRDLCFLNIDLCDEMFFKQMEIKFGVGFSTSLKAIFVEIQNDHADIIYK